MKKILGLLVFAVLGVSAMAAQNFDNKGIITRWCDDSNTTNGLGRAFITNSTPGTARLVIDQVYATTGSFVTTNITTVGNLTVSGALTNGAQRTLGSAVITNALTVGASATIGTTLGLTTNGVLQIVQDAGGTNKLVYIVPSAGAAGAITNVLEANINL